MSGGSGGASGRGVRGVTEPAYNVTAMPKVRPGGRHGLSMRVYCVTPDFRTREKGTHVANCAVFRSIGARSCKPSGARTATMLAMERILVVDSHTEGEPTRLVLEGGPDLGQGTLAERRARFRDRYDHYRSAIVNEPRGSDVMVGALLCAPRDPTCAAGVIFFNNVGYLGMCGHGTIGVAATLAHLGRLQPGVHRIETPVGVVEVELHDHRRVTVTNVPSYRVSGNVEVEVPGHGRVQGSVAWGGNWFFLTGAHGQALRADNVDALTDYAWRLQQALRDAGITGTDGAPIDHVELFGPSTVPGVHSRNFVLCPGRAYDRSPCGTGTSAKLACLHAEGGLAPGEVWRQESVIGGVFEASYTLDPRHPGHVLPRITGTAWVTAEITLVLQVGDPFRFGIGRSAR